MWTRFLLAALLAGIALPASAQEREWIFDTGDEDAYLVFGVPESDDAGVSFGCTLQSGEIRIFLPEAGDDLKPNATIRGILPDGLVTVVSIQWFASAALELTYRRPAREVATELLYPHDEPRLEVVEQGRPWSFDGDGTLFL